MSKRVPGTRDILPQEASRWQKIEEVARHTFSTYNYSEIRTPVIEESALFNRSLGESTEVIQKQMFLIKKEKDVYALRPEATASIVRAYIENNLDKTAGFIKLYYIGPMFRLERPQKGRLRQFHHIGAEAIGSYEPFVDVEVISLADKLLKDLFITGYQIRINSLGCPKDKKGLAQILREALKGKMPKFCPDCRRRFKQNVLRIMDCKKSSCREMIEKLDIQDKHLCADCLKHFTQVKAGLDDLKIGYRISPHLVRGLDYYTRTVFEINHPDLGAQDAIGAGGRYDNLVSDLGGCATGAIGFALGVERLLFVSSLQSPVSSKFLVYIITLGEAARQQGLKVLDNLRKNGIAADGDYEGKSLKGAMRLANAQAAKYVVIIGEDELKKGSVTLKDMASGEQKEIKPQDLIGAIKC